MLSSNIDTYLKSKMGFEALQTKESLELEPYLSNSSSSMCPIFKPRVLEKGFKP